MGKIRRRLLHILSLRMSVKRTAVVFLLPSVFLVGLLLQAIDTGVIVRHLAQPFSIGRHVYQKTGCAGGVSQGQLGGKIILMTYGRSGSSFTSEIIQQDPSVFYTFEPLYNLMRRFHGKLQARRAIVPDNSQNGLLYDQQSMTLTEVFLNCGFEALNVSDINNFQLRNSADSRLLWGCVQRRSNWSPAGVMECFIQARQTCLKRPIKMVKTIRLRGTAARMMIEKYPNLKLLYLVRDPRGTLTSQRRVFNAFKWEGVSNFSSDFCKIFREDLAVVGQLMEMYPARVMVLRYEALATDPLRVSEQMYRFLGLNFTEGIRHFVFNKTMAGEKHHNAYGTSRKNSTETATSWRSKLTYEAAMDIDKNCRDVYDSLGYLPIESAQHLVDMTRDVRKQVRFHGQWL